MRPPMPDGRAGRVADREDDAASELVVRAAAVRPLARQPTSASSATSRCAGSEHLDHLIPAVGRPAELELLDRFVREAALVQVFERRRAGLRLRQDDVVEGDRLLEDFAQPGLSGVFAARPLVDLDAGLRRQPLERLGEVSPRASSRS
jgi:hypothetical protein